MATVTAGGDVQPGRRATRDAVLMVCGGAVCTSVSAGFVKLAHVSPGTAAFVRCALAVVVLAPLAVIEMRRVGLRERRLVLIDVAAGVFLGIDYVCWAASISAVGASIATVLINLQVVAFPLFSWLFLRAQPTRRFLLVAPIMLCGVAMAAGVLGHAEPGSSPVRGLILGCVAGVAYAAYLFLLHLGGRTGHVISPVAISTGIAGMTALIAGLTVTSISLQMSLSSWAWLTSLALIGQVVAWIMISSGLPRLPPQLGGSLLLLHPVLAVVFGVVILAERPSWTQLAGCCVVVVGVWFVSARPGRRQDDY